MVQAVERRAKDLLKTTKKVTLTDEETQKLREEFPAHRNELIFLIENPDLVTKEKLKEYEYSNRSIKDLNEVRKAKRMRGVVWTPWNHLGPDPLIDRFTRLYILDTRRATAEATKPPAPGAKPIRIWTNKIGEKRPGNTRLPEYGRITNVDFR